jgi:hypothetical protein
VQSKASLILKKCISKCKQHLLEVLGYYDDNPGLLIWGCRHCGLKIKGEVNEEDNNERGEGNSTEDTA